MPCWRPGGGGPGGVVQDGSGLPPGTEPVRPHVRLRSALGGGDGIGASSGVSGVLDVLVGRAVRVAGWEQAIDLALDRPDLVVVTGEGDRFADSGWRVRSAKGVVTAAAVEEARHRAEEASVQADAAAERLRVARRMAEETRARRQQ